MGTRQRIPGDAADDRQTRTFLAVHDLHARHGRVTVAEVALALGVAKSTAHDELLQLRDRGLVAGVGTRKAGALRPTLVLVARGPE